MLARIEIVVLAAVSGFLTWRHFDHWSAFVGGAIGAILVLVLLHSTPVLRRLWMVAGCAAWGFAGYNAGTWISDGIASGLIGAALAAFVSFGVHAHLIEND